jgi:tetratricopeptide (TPR) repeat protein
MISIKKLALALFISLSFVAVAPVVAEEAAAAAQGSAANVIAHIERGLAEVQKSDFSAARLHLKAARDASEKLSAENAAAKQGLASVIQGQIHANAGNVEKASAELNKALELYRSIK